MKNRILSILMAGILALSMLTCAAVAEETAVASDIQLTDITLSIGDSTYSFPVSVAALTAQGVNVPDVSDLTKGLYYSRVDVDDGRNGFAVRVEYLTSTEDPYWVTGVNMDSTDHAGACINGMTLGQTTRGEIVNALGADTHGNTYESDELYYTAWNLNYNWHLGFDGNKEDSVLTSITAYCELVNVYGEVTAANTESAELPAVSELPFGAFILDGQLYEQGATVQALLDNGWVLPAAVTENTVAARDGDVVQGDHLWLYNGSSLVKIDAFNCSDAECTYAECTIKSIYADVCNNATIVCADGLTNGVSTYDEAVAILGEPTSTEDGENGFKNVKFTVINNVTYTLGVNPDGSITYITISGLL